MLTAHSRFWNNHYKQGSHDSYGLKYQGTEFSPWGLKLFFKEAEETGDA